VTRRAVAGRSDLIPAAIYAAGQRGTMALQNLLANDSYGMKPVGFIDDDPAKAGKQVKGFPVLGTIDALPLLIANGKIKAVVVASPTIDPKRLRAVSDLCRTSRTPILSFKIAFDVEEMGDPEPGAVADFSDLSIVPPRRVELSH